MRAQDSPTRHDSRGSARGVALGISALAASLASACIFAHGSEYGDPANPTSICAPLIPLQSSGIVRKVDVRSRQWRQLFTASGSLRAEPPLTVKKPDTLLSHGSHGEGRSGSLQPADEDGGADTIACIVSIDRQTNRVEAAHGPIPRLAMPGMTMVLRVRDSSLLDSLAQGRCVGIVLEDAASTDIITRVIP